MDHELGHDKIANGEVDINKVRQRLEEIVGKDNIDAVAEAYIKAYEGTDYTIDEIWEECICDSLGDMNIFASDEVLSELMNLMMPNIKQAVAETTTPNKTRGSPKAEGKASREFENRKKKGKVPSRDDFATNAMIWAFSSSTLPGDTKVFYDAKNSTWNQLVAENTEERYSILVSIEDTAENAEAIRNLYNEVYNENNRTQQRNGNVIRNDYERYWSFSNNGGNDNVNVERQITNGQTGNIYGKESDSNRNTNIQRSLSNSKQVKHSREIDSVGNKLTKEQAEYFKDSKVRDDEGNLKVMYHGSSESFTIFDKSQRNASNWYGEGFYFTENKSEAYFYGDKLFETYLNVENPYIPTADKILEDGTVEFAPSFIDDLKNRFSEIKSIKNPTASQITEVLQSKRYDGIIVGENVVIFESNQAKNIDNKNPTSNPDIRFSRELDTAYLDAVKSGDMETAQKMVDEAAKLQIVKVNCLYFDFALKF